MFGSRNLRVFMSAAVILLLVGLTLSAQESKRRGRKYKAPPPTSRIEVSVVRDQDSKPVENAAVIFHLVGETGNMELKSNDEGKSMIDVLPIGSTIRLQILAKGFQTYGEDFKIDKPQMTFNVRLKRPGEQYSIYKHHDGQPDYQDPDAEKPADPSGTSKDKPAQAPAKPDSAQPQPH